MNLVSLKIERERWGSNEGKHKGMIKFDNELGEVAIILNDEMMQKIFSTCAEGLINTAKVAATNLTCSVIEHKKLIEEGV